MSLRTKLVSLLLLLLFSVVGTFWYNNYRTEKNLILQAEKARKQQAGAAWLQVCTRTNSSKRATALSYFRTFFDNQAMAAALCINDSGRVYTSTRQELTGLTYPNAARKLFYYDDGTPNDDIALDSYSIGNETAKIFFSRRQIQADFTEQVNASALRTYTIGALAMAIGCVGILLISGLMSRPVKILTDGIRNITDGNMNYLIPLPRESEMRMIAHEFNTMTAKLRQLDELKKDFTAGVTHDLRSPVTAIKISTENIAFELDRKQYSHIPQQLAIIEDHIQRLNQLIDTLLKVAKIESGEEHMDLRPENLEDIADEAVKNYRHYARQKNLTLDLVVETTVPVIPLDHDKIQQCLSNLIVNAIKFTDKGSITVTVKADRGSLYLTVADTGRGIAPDLQPRIFGKFTKNKEQGHGTGLGLFITKKLVELHGGHITFSSAEGKGTSFTITLPAAKGNNEEKHTADR